jgi:hypothetical protein
MNNKTSEKKVFLKKIKKLGGVCFGSISEQMFRGPYLSSRGTVNSKKMKIVKRHTFLEQQESSQNIVEKAFFYIFISFLASAFVSKIKKGPF